ncbi:hypothetical protein D6792_02750 [Candidatus Parcubacteria bacterium]|nr:MAG: hypothetical protein D6792_02750 [Candidatus Parcubacteria bacterium]GIW68900.1 MAG: hypothetical protein KatS3mg100_394 [Candidatus Parcubacteria bacterium]
MAFSPLTKESVRFLTALVVVSFFLHLAWEFAHASLYDVVISRTASAPLLLRATVGDVVLTLLAVGNMALLGGSLVSVQRTRWHTLLGFALYGAVVALFVEYRALAWGKWGYTSAMPVVPGFEVGLSPLAQMVVLLPLSVFLAGRAVRCLERKG